MRKKSFIVVLSIGLIITIFVVVKVVRLSRIPGVSIKDKKAVFKPAPDFMLFDIDGSERRLADFKGKVVILDFWATWCPPCKAEIPHFIELYNEYKDEGLEIIGVSLDRNAGRVVGPFTEENGINYTVLLGDKDITDLYGGIISIPTTFIIDREGGIRKKYIGYRDKYEFENAIKELL